MKNVEIITSQNVVLQYELAPVQDRALAFILDLFLALIFWAILTGVFSAMFSFTESGPRVAIIVVTCLACMYSLLFEYFNRGRSIGKLAMRIQVIKLDGSRATFADYATRWVFRLIDVFFSLGGVAVILILSSDKAQRIGDIIANTVVVKTQPKTNIDLQDLLLLHQTSKYVPRYPQAKNLCEQDALLIKTTLERYRRLRNEAHQEAVQELASQIQNVLGVQSGSEKRTEFLQTILNDYVVLSR